MNPFFEALFKAISKLVPQNNCTRRLVAFEEKKNFYHKCNVDLKEKTHQVIFDFQ